VLDPFSTQNDRISFESHLKAGLLLLFIFIDAAWHKSIVLNGITVVCVDAPPTLESVKRKVKIINVKFI
tara:strand:- start:341 stop:547 length:207 start_codon:yes stop_codon:yes gene_type:complete